MTEQTWKEVVACRYFGAAWQLPCERDSVEGVAVRDGELAMREINAIMIPRKDWPELMGDCTRDIARVYGVEADDGGWAEIHAVWIVDAEGVES